VSKIIPIIYVLKLALSENSSVMGGVMKQLTDTLLDQIQLKFPDLHQRFQFYCSTYLDPRFKKFAFSDEAALEKIQDRLREEVISVGDVTQASGNQDRLKEEVISVGDVTQASGNPVSIVDHGSSLWDRFDEDIAKQCSSSTARPDIELRRYAEEQPIPRFSNPLEWWRIHGPMLPQLQEVAKKCFSCPGISVQSERMFSDIGENVYLRRRKWLKNVFLVLVSVSNQRECFLILGKMSI